MKHLKKAILGIAIAAAASGGGTVAAGDYPPSAPTPTIVVAVPAPTLPAGSLPSNDPAPTVVVAVPSPTVVIAPGVNLRAGATLPSTGSDSTNTLMIAGGALVAGIGIVIASKLRRRPSIA